ncbi:hypothetical protein [Clostridium malenominatum]
MFIKIGIILNNFFKSSKKKELFELILAPALITSVLYLFCNNKINDFDKFIISFNDTAITITALLSAFGLTALSILVTSSSENIETAKMKLTQRRDGNRKLISYYKLLAIRSFFSLFLQFGVLILAIINKFLIEICRSEIIFYIEVFLLMSSIFTQIFVVNSMYYLLATPKVKSSDEEDSDDINNNIEE